MAEPYTFKQLKDMKVDQLRQISQGLQNPELEGYSTWHKDHLLPILCKVLNVSTHHIAHGARKTQIKANIRKLEARRDEVLKAGDGAKLATVRRQIHVLKHQLRNMAEIVEPVSAAKAPAAGAATAAPVAPAAPAAPAAPKA